MPMESCKITLDQMNYTADFNALATVGQMVKQLPYSLQSKFAKNLDSRTQNGREPKFRELTEFGQNSLAPC